MKSHDEASRPYGKEISVIAQILKPLPNGLLALLLYRIHKEFFESS